MNNYIDTHSHIMYGIDDGAKSCDESLSIIKQLKEFGFNDIILTPHYRNSYKASNTTKNKIYNELVNILNKEHIDVKLYLANEVFISNDLLDLIEKNEIKTLNNYLFLELPFNSKINGLDRILYSLELVDLNIILVHPERYVYLKKQDYESLFNRGVMFQINYESITGKYGNKAKKNVKMLLKNNLVYLAGTDIHSSTSSFFRDFPKIKKKICKYITIKKFEDISFNNPKKIIK